MSYKYQLEGGVYLQELKKNNTSLHKRILGTSENIRFQKA